MLSLFDVELLISFAFSLTLMSSADPLFLHKARHAVLLKCHLTIDKAASFIGFHLLGDMQAISRASDR